MVKVNVSMSPGGIMRKILMYRTPRYNGCKACVVKVMNFSDGLKFEYVWLNQEQLEFIADTVMEFWNPNKKEA